MSKYMALTIGPVYNTISEAKKTRTVWAASYFFSWFMKQIVEKTNKSGFNIILPSTKEAKSKYGAGLYSDRIYFDITNSGTKQILQNIINDIVLLVAADMKVHSVCLEEAAINFLHQYLNCHIKEVTINDDINVLKSLNEVLNSSELQNNFVNEYNSNLLLQYLELKVSEAGLIAKDAFDDVNKRHFRSLPEIASASLERMNKEAYNSLVRNSFGADENDLLDIIKLSPAFKDAFKPYHKYQAIVYADGDNISGILSSIKNDFGKLQEFSAKLFEFGIKAEQIIVNYGGNGIYLGGEDILAFTPVACLAKNRVNDLQTIFSLIKQLDTLFKEVFESLANELHVQTPTLSYGILICYTKHPLQEAMKAAHDLLEIAKKEIVLNETRRANENISDDVWKELEEQAKRESKNTIALRFQKHSGQIMQCSIRKSRQASWFTILKTINLYTKESNAKKGENTILSSVIHRLKDDLFFALFAAAARDNRLPAFFDNSFNEDIHAAGSGGNEFITAVRMLAEELFKDGYTNEECKDILFTVLRFIHFIKSNKE